MLKRFLACSTAVLTAAIACALYAPTPADLITAKLDRELQKAVVTDAARNSPLRVLLQAKAGTGLRVGDRISEDGGSSTQLAPDLLSARLSVEALKRIAADADLIHASIDAPVRGAATTSKLAQDVLLGTEGLLTVGATTTRTFPYTGRNIGIAIIDSGIRPNANLKVIATYDFLTSNGKKVSANDPFGHGTHVAGIATSNGTT